MEPYPYGEVSRAFLDRITKAQEEGSWPIFTGGPQTPLEREVTSLALELLLVEVCEELGVDLPPQTEAALSIPNGWLKDN